MDVARGARAALGPARLIWGLLLVLSIAAGANLFDAVHLAAGGAAAGPAGLAGGPWQADVAKLAERSAARATSDFLAGTPVATDASIERPLSEWSALLDRAYVARREAILAAETPQPGELSALQARYRAIAAAVEAARPRGPFEAFAASEWQALRSIVGAILAVAPGAAIESSLDLLIRNPVALVGFAPWTSLLGGVPLLLVIALLGGGLARLAALEAARGTKASALDAAAWVRSSAVRLVLTPLLPAIVLLLLLAAIILFGVVLRVPGLNIVAAAAYGIVLLIAFLLVTAAVAALLTLPMAIASVAAGDADAADAFVRPMSYLFRHTGRTVGVHVVGLFAAIVGTIVVAAVVGGMLAVAAWASGLLGGAAAEAVGGGGFFSTQSGTPLPAIGVTERIAGLFVDLWEGLLLALVAGYALSAISDIGVRAYLFLRYRCDGQDCSTLDGDVLGAD